MMAGRQPGFFDVDERLRELSAKGDDLERIAALVDFEAFRPELERAVPRSDGTKGGRPAFDHMLMFKALLLQAMHALSDERVEYLVKDRLSFMRFLGLGLADPVPDANTIWTFREALKRAGAVEALFARFDAALREAGYLAMGGQIVDASIVVAPKQRNTAAEKAAIKAGGVPEGWAERPAKLRQKDRDARWTVKFSKAKPREDGARQVDIAVPAFGYKNHVGIDRRHGLIRRWTATDAATHEGARLGDLLDPDNTASDVWGDTAYRSEERGAAGRARLGLAHSPQEAEGPADAGAHPEGQRAEVGRARRRRARLRPPEGADGTGGAHHRHRQGAGEDRPRQPRLQHAALRLAQRPDRAGVDPGRRVRRHPRAHGPVPGAPLTP
jgi:transposase, IS5 family